jgi:hypothetical protein
MAEGSSIRVVGGGVGDQKEGVEGRGGTGAVVGATGAIAVLIAT